MQRKEGSGGKMIEQGKQAVDADVQMASETHGICPMPNSPHLHLLGPAETGQNAGRVIGGTQTWTCPSMSTDDQSMRREGRVTYGRVLQAQVFIFHAA